MATTYEPIATATTSTSPGSYTFSSIPSTYTDIYYVIRAPSAGYTNLTVRVNGDTGSNYSVTQLYGNGVSAASLRYTSITNGLGGVGNGASIMRGNFMNYANTTTYKTWVSRGGTGNGTYIDAVVSMWRSTAAINSITFIPEGTTFENGTTLTIYGIKAA
jgi:hypothetical protein